MKKSIFLLIIIILLFVGYKRYQQSQNSPEKNPTDTMLSSTECEQQGGKVVFGIGPPPECDAGQTSLGWIKETGAIEGALCCTQK